jgi:hypothetical protein
LAEAVLFNIIRTVSRAELGRMADDDDWLGLGGADTEGEGEGAIPGGNGDSASAGAARVKGRGKGKGKGKGRAGAVTGLGDQAAKQELDSDGTLLK